MFIVWLNDQLIRMIHARQIAEHGGDPGIRDPGLLDSALTRPQNRHAYAEDSSDVPALAATLAFGISKNHPFVDGNKRVAAVAAETFVRLNGYVLAATNQHLLDVMLSLAAGTLDEDELIEWFRENCEKNPENLGS